MPVQMRAPDFLSIFCRLCRGAAGLPPCEYNYDTMATLSHQSREKIALAVFAGLIVLSLCGFGWYLLVGHSWNVAASNIDDTFGSMEGYTAIVYDGVEHPVDADSDVALPDADDEPAAPGLLSAGGSDDDAGHSGEGSGAGFGSTVNPAAGAGATDSRSRGSGVNAEDAKASEGGTGRGTAASDLSGTHKGVTAAEAKESYEEKGATVFSLDTDDPGRYEEGVILKKGAHRFGVLSVLESLPARLIERQIAYFAEHEVDFIVVLTSDKEYLEGVEGVDIALSIHDEELFVMGETVNGTFFVDAPDEGSVGVILISPSNVVSAKVIEEL